MITWIDGYRNLSLLQRHLMLVQHQACATRSYVGEFENNMGHFFRELITVVQCHPSSVVAHLFRKGGSLLPEVQRGGPVT